MDQISTIPRNIATKGELVVLPRKEYKELLRSAKIQKHDAIKIDPDLVKSLQELHEGKTVGPFRNAKSLMRSLRTSKTRHY